MIYYLINMFACLFVISFAPKPVKATLTNTVMSLAR